ncbi:DUF7352 domain-containing protein [Paenibacillus alba]|uniref:DUF7352 domain-containing protein n=1 Tax=Paenibacillus alba TaxID=1197127 RepID=A0ABU6GBC7_9BACL|nr:hypothetical protein [Paenibacillus alba]MEC0231270.1 hypothetical protein [Paenibacillus alba]
MKTIYKYTLDVAASQTLTLPFDSQILSVCEQNHSVVVYALTNVTVNPYQPQEEIYDFKVYGTGELIDINIPDYSFLGTVNLHRGEIMLHIFYKKSVK